MFVLIFVNLNLTWYNYVSCDPSDVYVMPNTEVHARAHSSYGNITTVLRHLEKLPHYNVYREVDKLSQHHNYACIELSSLHI